jgi:hypothetical protein
MFKKTGGMGMDRYEVREGDDVPGGQNVRWWMYREEK